MFDNLTFTSDNNPKRLGDALYLALVWCLSAVDIRPSNKCSELSKIVLIDFGKDIVSMRSLWFGKRKLIKALATINCAFGRRLKMEGYPDRRVLLALRWFMWLVADKVLGLVGPADSSENDSLVRVLDHAINVCEVERAKSALLRLFRLDLRSSFFRVFLAAG